MPVFNYTVKDNAGKTFTGTIDAPSEAQAATVLRNRGWVSVSIEPRENPRSLQFWLKKIRTVPENEMIVFTRQLATMVVSGLPLDRALSILTEQTKNERMREIVSAALRDVEGGMQLSKSLSKHPEAFDRVYVNLVKAGEASGSLDKVLLRLADVRERQKAFRSALRSALLYPIIIVVAMVAVFILMIVFVVPKLTEMYKSINVDLPLPTRIMIFLSDTLVKRGWLIVLLLIPVAAAFLYFRETEYGEHKMAELSYRMPIFGKLKYNSDLAELTRTLGLLVNSGLPILEALEIVRDSMSNVLYREALQDVARQVERGSTLSKAFKSNVLFPALTYQMAEVGEETGKLDEVLEKVSKFFESEAEYLIKTIGVLIEPIIMITLGIMVGLLVFSVVMPIYKLTTYF